MRKILSATNSPFNFNPISGIEIAAIINGTRLNRIIELAALACQVPVSIVSFIDADLNWQHAVIGMDINESSKSTIFFEYVSANDGGVFEVENAAVDNRFQNEEMVLGYSGVRFYAGILITDDNGQVYGVLSVLGFEPGVLTNDQKRALKLFSLEIMTVIDDARLKKDFENLSHDYHQSISAGRELTRQSTAQDSLTTPQRQTIEHIEEYKFLADSIPQMVWTSNPDGTVDYYNKYWFDFTRVSLEDIKRTGWDPVLHPDDAATDLKVWNISLANGTLYERENRFKRYDGVYKWHLSRALPLRNEDGRIIKWFGSCIDIDEYKKALDLETRISQYEDFNRIISHNLRGPAGSIEAIIGMLAESQFDQDNTDLLAMLQKSSVALNDTLSELMKVLDVRNNKSIAYDKCDLNQIMTRIDGMLKAQILATKAIITTDFKTAFMSFPKLYLESIFYNMVSNALKYCKPGVPAQINIESKIVNGRVVLTFTDNGLGIDLNQHGNDIFKLHNTFHNGYDSKGVGLFMTKTQIETFGGKITVESEPGVGAVFNIMF